MATQDTDYLLKVLILGDSSVGKTCLLLKFCDNNFVPTHMPTIGIFNKLKIFFLKKGIDFRAKNM